jgi:hypothetical protein
MKNAKKRKNILIGSAVAAGIGSIAALNYAATHYLIKVALDRQIPKSIKKAQQQISGVSPDPVFIRAVEESSKKLEEANCETIELTSRDGIKLIGHLQMCKKPQRILIAVHGWRSSWTNDFGMVADFWHQNSCIVLYVEQRGQNNSGGDYMSFGMMERYDCLDWIQWVIQRFGDRLPLFLGGVSMGASTVLMASNLDLPSCVCGIIADCGFTSADAIWRYIVQNNLHLPYESVLFNELCRKRIHIGSKDFSTLDALKECHVPVLFIHGTDDHFVPIQMTFENYKACSSPKRLFVVPGADHGMSYYKDKEGYERAVCNFWKEFGK